VHSHVHYFSGFLLWLTAKAGTPQRIAHFRSVADGKGEGIWRRTRNAVLKRWIDRHATDIWGVSCASLDGSLGVDWRTDPRCRVIYSGIDCCPDTSQPNRQGVREEFRLPADATLLIHVGRMTSDKNTDRVIRIFSAFLKLVSNSYLLLVGAPREPVHGIVSKLTDELKLDGRVLVTGTRADVRRLLLAADTMVAPSLWEGLPGAVLEASSVGTPVLASDIPPMIEVAKFLPIRTLSLSQSDEVWATVCAELCADESLPARVLDAFAASPFTMLRSASVFQESYAVHREAQPAYHKPGTKS
jgi:glycosyltransferase involved in cell wall biosynthesis